MITKNVALLVVLSVLGCDSEGKGTTPGTIDTASDDTGDIDTGDIDTDCSGEATEDDADGDGIPDADEEAADNLDPYTADSDGDGTCDGAEDSDEDGLTNAEEIALGTDINNVDSDGDNIIDGVEVSAGLDPLDSADGDLDPDGDGLTNAEELGIDGSSTDHNKWDSDKDGYPDGYEVRKDADPNDSKDWPAFSETLTCTSAEAKEGELFADMDDDGEHDDGAAAYYGDDYFRDYPAIECVCTIELPDVYGRVDDVTVFAPTLIHNNSDWEGEPKPQITAIHVPFAASASRGDGTFFLKKITQSNRLDVNKDTVAHWETRSKSGAISTGGAVEYLGGPYTVWVAVENSAEELIGEKDDFTDGCPRLSGDDGTSGYEGYLQIELDVPPPPAGIISSGSSLTQTTRFVLASGENKRLRLLSVSGSSAFHNALIEKVSISDWSETAQVTLHAPGQPPLVLTSAHSTVTLSEPVWLHQIDVQVDGDALPELSLEHVQLDEATPQLPGLHFPLTWQQLDTFLSTANSLLSVSSLLPEDVDTSLQALAARMVIVEGGQSWLHLDARDSGSLLRLPINKAPDGSWRFETQGDDLTFKGSALLSANSDLTLTIEEGSVGSLVLDEATLALGAD